MTDLELLRATRRVLLEYGWWQGAYAKDYNATGGPFCLVGAARFAVYGQAYSPRRDGLGEVPVWNADCQLARALLCVEERGPVPLNDRLCHAVDDVLAALDKAIACHEADSAPAAEPERELVLA